MSWLNVAAAQIADVMSSAAELGSPRAWAFVFLRLDAYCAANSLDPRLGHGDLGRCDGGTLVRQARDRPSASGNAGRKYDHTSPRSSGKARSHYPERKQIPNRRGGHRNRGPGGDRLCPARVAE